MSIGDHITGTRVGLGTTKTKHMVLRKEEFLKLKYFRGSGSASVGTAVICNTRGPRFESSHQQNLY